MDKKKIEEYISSLERQKKIHRNKINEYKGSKDYLIGYWEKEIEQFEEKQKRLKEKLEKG